ncbi:MAG: ABC transporter permease [Candidatus Hodarchaeota archaeon]
MKHTNFSTDHPIRSHGSFWYQWLKMSKKEILIQFRYPIAFLMNFIQIIIIILFFTFSAKAFLPTDSKVGLTTAFTGTSIFFGFIIYYFIITGIYNVGNSLRNEQITGTLETIFLSPSSTLANMFSRMTYTIILNIIFIPFTYLIVTFAVGDIQIDLTNLSLWIYIFFTLISTLGLSFTLAGLALKLKEAMQPLLGLLEFTFMIFSGVFFPISLLGPAVILSLLFPISYGIDLVKSTISGNTITEIAMVFNQSLGVDPLLFVNIQILFVIFLGITFPIIGLWIFHYTVTQAKKTGNLAQF